MGDKKKQIDWHAIVGDLFDEALDALSGFAIRKQGREKRSYYQVDYLCEIEPDQQYSGPIEGIRPFDHLEALNLFELKFWGDVLDEDVFRYYSGRSLAKAHQARKGMRGKTTLTIMTVHRPTKLLALEQYGFAELSPWKYRSRWVDGMPIYIVPLNDLKGLDGGEAMAYLQALEARPEAQRRIWPKLLRMELAGKELLKKLIMRIDEEALMSIAEEWRLEGEQRGERKGKREGKLEGKREGKLEGKREGLYEGLYGSLVRILERATPDIRARFETKLQATRDIEALEAMQIEILDAVMSNDH